MESITIILLLGESQSSNDWRNEAVSDRQRQKLAELGLPIPRTKGEAWDLIKKAKKRPKGRPKKDLTSVITQMLQDGELMAWQIRDRLVKEGRCRQSLAYKALDALERARKITSTKQGKNRVVRLVKGKER